MSARKQRADRQAERRPHAAPAPLNLIHTNNSPNPINMRVPEGLHQDAGPSIRQVVELVSGRLFPLEFLLVKRGANAKST